jgi:hypothetical protein
LSFTNACNAKEKDNVQKFGPSDARPSPVPNLTISSMVCDLMQWFGKMLYNILIQRALSGLVKKWHQPAGAGLP